MTRNYKKNVNKVEVTVVDEDGVVKETRTTQSYSINSEEDYIKIYIKHINYIRDLPLGMEAIIYELMKCMNYGNYIVINSHIKRVIASNTNKSFNTINQYITKLVEHKILIREGRGVYYLNPLFYSKGKWKDIVDLRERLELNIVYEDGKYTVTHI